MYIIVLLIAISLGFTLLTSINTLKKHLISICYISLLTIQIVHCIASIGITKNQDISQLIYTPFTNSVFYNYTPYFNTQIVDGYEIYEPEMDNPCYKTPIPCTSYTREVEILTTFSENKKGIPTETCLEERIQLRGNTLAEGFKRINTKQ